MVVIVNIEVVTYEAMTPKGERLVVQFLVVSVDIGVVTYEDMTPRVGCQWEVHQGGYWSVRVDTGVSVQIVCIPD